MDKMDYKEMIAKMENHKINLVKLLENTNLSKEEYDSIQHSIDNDDYIIELIGMNHYLRGYAY